MISNTNTIPLSIKVTVMKALNKAVPLSPIKKEIPDKKAITQYNRYAFDFISRLKELRDLDTDVTQPPFSGLKKHT